MYSIENKEKNRASREPSRKKRCKDVAGWLCSNFDVVIDGMIYGQSLLHTEYSVRY